MSSATKDTKLAEGKTKAQEELLRKQNVSTAKKLADEEQQARVSHDAGRAAQEQLVRKVNTEKAKKATEEEQKSRVAQSNASVAQEQLLRKTNQAKAKKAVDEEQQSRVAEDQAAVAREEMLRKTNQAKAIKAIDEEQKQRVEEHETKKAQNVQKEKSVPVLQELKEVDQGKKAVKAHDLTVSQLKDDKPALKATATKDKSAPIIEKDVKIGKVDRDGFIKDVETGTKLNHAGVLMKDRSDPVIEAGVKVQKRDPKALGNELKSKVGTADELVDVTEENKPLMAEIAKGKGLKKADEVADRSAPKIEEGTKVKTWDKGAFTGEIEKGAELKHAGVLMKDRSAPKIDPTVQVKKSERENLKKDIALYSDEVTAKDIERAQ